MTLKYFNSKSPHGEKEEAKRMALTTLSRLLIVVLSWFLLTGCVQDATPTPSLKEDSDALFGDSDIDKAQLEIASSVSVLKGKEETPLSEGIELPALSENQNDITAQAVLPDTSGFVYYIQHDPSSTTEPFSIFRFDQHNDVNTKIYAGLREIQAVSGNVEGTIIALSMREATNPTSDFEIFRFFVDTRRTQRLTDNTVDDTNISMSSDALKLVWEQAIAGKATVVLRSYRDTTTLVDFQESILSRSEPQRQPSLSSNGRFIALIRDLKNGRDVLERFDTATNSYLGITGSSTSVLEHPSISNDGNKTVYLENRPNGTDLIVVKTVSKNSLQVVANSARLEHPFISADGLFVTYGQLENNAIKVFTKNLNNNGKLRITNPVSPINHLGMSWQLPFASQQKVIPFDQTGPDRFGFPLAMSGSLMVVGARDDNDSTGSAYLLSRNFAGEWSVFKKLVASDGAGFDRFGSAVAISGNTVVVGASSKNRDLDGDGRLEQSVGSVYIFERDQGGKDNWGEAKKLVASDEQEFASFGQAVTISADIVAVGGNLEQVYLFGRNVGGPNNWGEIKIVSNSDRQGRQNFGGSVAVSGDTLVVGAPIKNADINNDGSEELFVGAAYIFQKDQGGTDNWGEVKKLTASDVAAFDFFGQAVAISGDVVVIGTPGADHDTNNDGVVESGAGAAYLFARNQGGTDNWGEVKKLVASDATSDAVFGGSVAVSSDVVVVGSSAENHDTNNDGTDESSVGAAYVFSRNQGGFDNWGETKKLVAADGAGSDFYGAAVAISGKVIAVGAVLDDNSNGVDAGAIYIDER